jgi:hypothetical protein
MRTDFGIVMADSGGEAGVNTSWPASRVARGSGEPCTITITCTTTTTVQLYA